MGQMLEIVLLPFHPCCHGPATRARLCDGFHSCHSLDVVHLQYQRY